MLRLNRTNCKNVPQAPGVYRLYNAHKKLIYIGRAGKLRHRLSSWYQKDASRPKWKRELAAKAVYYDYITTSKTELKSAEHQRIRQRKPKYNHYSKRRK